MSYNTSVSTNLNIGKFNFFTNYGYNKARRHYKMTGERLDRN
ncbi:hypothetical protein [Bacteroidetes bacterium endosymbiont of Geopemphigus sp.]|nr:hypothetical protein [Bacteroidetes bacterium endosymbiont of Geopemphigus sp.]